MGSLVYDRDIPGSKSKMVKSRYIILFILASLPFINMLQFKFPLEYKLSLTPQNETSCVALENCASLKNMWETRHIMMNSLEVLLSLERAYCGFLGFSDIPTFKCPEENKKPMRRSFIGEGVEFVEPCSGAIKLFADGNTDPQEVVYDTINKMKITVGRVLVTGNCCWRLYNKKMFHGRSLTVRAGATHSGIGSVKSLEKLEECPS